MTGNILIVDDEESIRFTFTSFLSDAGHHVRAVKNHDEALVLCAGQKFDLAFVDIILEGKSGIDLLQKLKEQDPEIRVIIITGAPSFNTASKALRLGAMDYIVKPVREDTLLLITGLALQHKAMETEKERYRLNLEAVFKSVKDGIVSVDKDMNVVNINASATEICGFKRTIALKKPFHALLSNCGKRCLDALHTSIKNHTAAEIDHLECHAFHAPDQIVSISASPLIDSHDNFSGGVMIIRNETRITKLEQALKNSQGFEHIIGNSKSIQKIKAFIKNLADVQTTVLITGESGTGKELMAEALHYTSEKHNDPLVKVNCSALSETLLESELFGHIKGAFTGAVKDRVGRFEKADGGTLFLDEIGDISPKMQLRLLRVIEQKEFERVGDSDPIRVDVRIIAATNSNLKDKVSTGEYREDLYYRLNVVEISIPPLRERKEDIPLLVHHFLKNICIKLNKNIDDISADALEMLMAHQWPGNVRQLKNLLEHACILCRNTVITVDHLPKDFKTSLKKDITTFMGTTTLDARVIRNALDQTKGNKTKAARLLGISRRTIYRKIEQFKVKQKPH